MNEYETLRVGYAFIPPQRLEQVFDAEEALMRGTLFPELYLPYGVYDKAACGNKKGDCCR